MSSRTGDHKVAHAYVDGVEIAAIPPLVELSGMEGWMHGALNWVSQNRPDIKRLDAIVSSGDDTTSYVKELWFGGAPPLRAGQVRGVLRRFAQGDSTFPGAHSSQN